MSQQLVISSNPIETTVAVLENDRLVEIYVEHHARKALTGSIYKGRVTRVLPGMQSAFVNLGLQRDAFLYVTDVLDPSESLEEDLDAGPIKAEPIQPVRLAKGGGRSAKPGAPDASPKGAAAPAKPSRRRRRRRRRSARGRSPDEAAPAATVKEPAPDGPAEAAPERAGQAADAPVTLLPGESLAKYHGESGARGEGPREPEAESGRRAKGGRSPRPARRAASAKPAKGGTPPDAADTKPPDQDEASPAKPPRNSASVSGPSVVSELRLGVLNWIRKKVEPPKQAPPPPKPEEKASRPPRRRGSRRRVRKAAPPRSAAGRPRPGAPAKQPSKRRSGRRRGPQRRTQAGRPKGGPRHGGVPPRERQPSPQANIKDLLKPGQEVLVQVNKEPVGTKGARITSHVSLPGRYMIYMTTAKHNGVSRKIQPESERHRLRAIVDKHSKGKSGGFVVRSAARGVSEEILTADMDFLLKLWAGVQDKAQRRKAPAKLHSDLDIVERVMRDNLGHSYKTVWVDSEDQLERIVRFVERFQPEMTGRVKLYTKRQPIHDSFGITKDLERALKPRVWLKSGGYLVINQTEALVAIDVNTGRYVGKSNRLEDTVLRTNLEAAGEIVRQLRLRDLGGIIVIDFIDMEDRKNRQSVQQVLQEALKNTRSPSRVLPFNDFGLVVITRKAVRQSLERALCMPCPACSGGGTVKSHSTILSEIFAAGDRLAANSKRGNGRKTSEVTLRVHPEIAKSLKRKRNSHLENLEAAVGRAVTVRGDSSLHPEKFTLG